MQLMMMQCKLTSSGSSQCDATQYIVPFGWTWISLHGVAAYAVFENFTGKQALVENLLLHPGYIASDI